MFMSSRSSELASRSLNFLRNVGAWVFIQPAQTYVATRIPGFGECKSTYCAAVRRGPSRPTASRLTNCQNPAAPVSRGATLAANGPLNETSQITGTNIGAGGMAPLVETRLALLETGFVSAPQGLAPIGLSLAAA